MRILAFSVALAALALAGCVDTGSTSGTLAVSDHGPRPAKVVVGDFTFAAELVVIDHGFSTRQEAKGGDFPLLERRQRTAARVNDEIVATIVANLREAGLSAQPGGEQGAAGGGDALLVSGRLRGADEGKDAKGQPKYYGFGPGKSGVVADMTLSRSSWGARKTVSTFAAEMPRAGKAGAARNAKTSPTLEADIAAALEAENAAPEKLSPDVEAQARGLANAITKQILAYAKTQGWVKEAPAVADAAPPKKPAKKKSGA